MATRTVSVEEFFGQQGGQQPTGQVQQPQPVQQQQPQQTQQDSLVKQQQRTITGETVEDKPTMTADEFFSEGERPIVVDLEEEDEKLNFLERVEERWSERGNMASEIEAAMARGEQGFAESAFQLIGKVGAGGVLDVLGEGVVSAFRGASAITPDIIEKPLTNAAKGAGMLFLDTPLGQAGLNAANEGMETYNQWKEENPRAARNVEAVVDIGLLATPVRGRTRGARLADDVEETGTLERTGTRLERSAAEQRVERRDDFLFDLVRPKQTPTVRAQQARRTTETGILQQRQVAPSTIERAMVQEVSKIDDVTPRNSTTQNFQAIQQHNQQLARNLEKQITENDFTFPKRQLAAELRRKKDELAESPVLVGDAEKTAERLINTFEKFVKEEKGTGSGLLKARKRFDREIERQKPKAFDPKQENAMSIALREIRETANEFLDRNAKDVEVKESLQQQHRLFTVMDNLAPKLASEADNRILRAWQKTMRVLGVRNQVVQSLAGLAGMGGLGAAAAFAPFVLKLGLGAGAVYGSSRLITSPLTKDFLAKLIQGLDASIKKTKDSNLIQELRADRAAVLELLQTIEEAEEDED